MGLSSLTVSSAKMGGSCMKQMTLKNVQRIVQTPISTTHKNKNALNAMIPVSYAMAQHRLIAQSALLTNFSKMVNVQKIVHSNIMKILIKKYVNLVLLAAQTAITQAMTNVRSVGKGNTQNIIRVRENVRVDVIAVNLEMIKTKNVRNAIQNVRNAMVPPQAIVINVLTKINIYRMVIVQMSVMNTITTKMMIIKCADPVHKTVKNAKEKQNANSAIRITF